MKKGYLTLAQVAARLRCSTGYVRRLIAGTVRNMPPLRGVRLHRWLVPSNAYEDWLISVEKRQADARKPERYGRNGQGGMPGK